MDAEWRDMLKLMGARCPPLLTEIAEEVKESGGEIAGSVSTMPSVQLTTDDDDARRSLAAITFATSWPESSALAPKGLEVDQPLSTFGLDSLLA